MSWRATAWAKQWREDSGITATEKLLLLILADYHDEERDVAWPAVLTLAGDALLKERQTRTLLGALQRKGFIAIDRKAGPFGANLYRLNFERSIAGVVQNLQVQKLQGWCAPATGVVQSGVRGGAIAIAPKPPLEPPLEPQLPKSEGAAKPKTAGAPKKRTAESPEVRVSEDFRGRMAAKYPEWPPGEVNDRIDEAVNFYKPKMLRGEYENMELCVQKWLRGDAERRNTNGQGQRSPNAQGQTQRAQSGSRYHPPADDAGIAAWGERLKPRTG